jgi:hypothetical protein
MEFSSMHMISSMRSRHRLFALFVIFVSSWLALPGRNVGAADKVELLKTPNGGIQPQAAVDERGVLHLVYLKGDPAAADVEYVRRVPGSDAWTAPIRVNSRPHSAVAVGTIRGAQLAVGKGGRVHVVWFGSDQALGGAKSPRGAPLLYARLNDQGSGFEAQRNLMQFTSGLDGGPSVAADRDGNVYVAWHGQAAPRGDETSRRLWIARSIDEGKSFASEAPANIEPTGACACCGARAFADRRGSVYVLYRAATEGVHRDMVLLTSRDRGGHFAGARIHPWKLNACPMSSESLAESGAGVLAAWETAGQVYFSRIDPSTGARSAPIAAPGSGTGRQHPAIAGDGQGRVLLAWTEGAGWQKGGSLAWQLYDKNGRPLEAKGRIAGAIPVWGLVSAIARPQGGFTILY